MSFTSDTKKELTGIMPDKKCCQLAEIAGFLRFSGTITLSFSGMGIKSVTENPAVARLFVSIMKEYFGAKSQLTITENPGPSKSKLYEMAITPEMNAEAILRETGLLGIKEGGNYLTDGIDPGVIKKRCCKKAALRGIFLASGNISDPVRSYHLEVACVRAELASDVRKLINSFGLKAKTVERRGKFVVYIKEAEQIADFLNIIGATGQYFVFQKVMMTKDLINNSNRASNCDLANTERAVGAAQKQLEAIRKIDARKGIESLPGKLYEAARMRLENPEMSLTELAELFDPPIGKSGLNHRFEKILKIAEDIVI